VIYQRVTTNDVESGKKEEVEKLVDPVSVEEISEEKPCCKKDKCKKKRRKFCLNICACIGVLTFLSMLVNMIVFSAVSMRMYMNYKRCFHSNQLTHLTEKIIDENKVIDRINFDIVTGFVNVKRTDDKKVVVRVYDKIRDHSHVDKKTFDSGIEMNQSVINVHSKTPAFSCKNLSTCCS
jgi:hypothetical protein